MVATPAPSALRTPANGATAARPTHALEIKSSKPSARPPPPRPPPPGPPREEPSPYPPIIHLPSVSRTPPGGGSIPVPYTCALLTWTRVRARDHDRDRRPTHDPPESPNGHPPTPHHPPRHRLLSLRCHTPANLGPLHAPRSSPVSSMISSPILTASRTRRSKSSRRLRWLQMQTRMVNRPSTRVEEGTAIPCS